MDPITKLNYLNSIPQYKQKSKEWFEQRKGKLTSSDAATALGVNPYSEPAEVFFKKCGVGGEFIGSDATNHGQKFETEAIDKYSKLMNKENHEFGSIAYTQVNDIRTKKYNYDLSFLAGSPDGIAVDLNGDEDLVMLEVKCPFRRKIEHGICPEYYYPQVQLNLMILDLQKADYIEYVPANTFPLFNKEPIMNIVRVHRNEKWLHKNIPKLIDFWNQVLCWKPVIHSHPLYPVLMSKIKKVPSSDVVKK